MSTLQLQFNPSIQEPEPKNNNKKRIIFVLLGVFGIALTGGIIFAVTRAGRGKELAPTDPNPAPTPKTEPILDQEDKDEKDKPKADQAPATAIPIPKKDDKASRTKDDTPGLLGKALDFIKSQSIPVRIAIGVGAVVLLVALGLAIWQVVEISLGSKSIFDLISGGDQPGKSELEIQAKLAKERLALRNSRLKATSLATM
jgi:flagellar basal body-associated protein FliL